MAGTAVSPMLIDTHTHLDSFQRAGDLDGALSRARATGVATMIAVGTGPGDWGLYRDIAGAKRDAVRFTVGLHPCSVDGGWEESVGRIAAYWQRGPGSESAALPVALGECGLDRFHLPGDSAEAERIMAWQKSAFSAQLGIARTLGCPLVVHSRGAFAECVSMIDASGVDWTRVVFHCFVEGPAEISELARRGGRGSFTGILTYKNAENVRAAARTQGLGRCMLETDAPFLAPVPHRGKSNEPAFVRHVAEFAAGLFGIPYDDLAAATTANSRAFFGL
jgi:TatD DNase family protein